MNHYYELAERNLSQYINRIEQFPLLKYEEEINLANKWRYEGDKNAARELVNSNLRYVVPVALRYKKYGLPAFDLIQQGNLGLMVAVQRFDPSRGTRLLKYALFWIRTFIQDFITRSLKIVRIGTTRAERKIIGGAKKAKNNLTLAKKEITNEEIAKELQVDEKYFEEYQKFLNSRNTYLDSPISIDDSRPLLERISSSEDPESILAQKDEEAYRLALLHDAIESLNEREQYIVRERLLTDNPIGLKEIAEKLNISMERVRQIEKRAFEKIKDNITSNKKLLSYQKN